jgi:hypothetical protein
MTRNKHLLKALIFSGFFLSAISSLSCDLFYESTREYLERYTNDILIRDPEPLGDYDYDNNHTLCISSEEDFTYRIYFTNPNEIPDLILTPMKLNGHAFDSDDEISSLFLSGAISYSYDFNQNPTVMDLTFYKNFLKSKDKEGDRNFSTYLHIRADPDGDNYNLPSSSPHPFSLTVNSKPKIIQTEQAAYKPVFGIIRESNGTANYVLCFNLKKKSSNEELYSDLIGSDNKYTININGNNYKFSLASGKPVFDDPEFLTSTEDIQKIVYPEADFNPSDWPVYFKTTGKPGAFNILITDTHGLKAPYTISTAESGKLKLNTIQPVQDATNADTITLTADFTTAQNVTVDALQIWYKINDAETWTKKECTSTNNKITLYIPGGTTTIQCKQAPVDSTADEVVSSSPITQEFTIDKNIYVANTQSNTAYKGGSSAHPVTLKNAKSLLTGKNEAWTIILTEDITASSNSDLCSTSAFFSYSNSSSYPDFALTIKGTSDSAKKTINANADENNKRRVIYASNFSLTLQYLNITGGYIADDGGAIYYKSPNVNNQSLTVKNCNLYSNTANNGGAIHTEETTSVDTCNLYSNHAVGSSGGAINSTKALTISSSNFYSNDSKNYGGAISFSSAGTSLNITGSTIGKKDYKNQVTSSSGKGGAIYLKTGAAENNPVSEIKNTIIGIGSLSEYSDSNFGNEAKYGGGIYCESYNGTNPCQLKFSGTSGYVGGNRGSYGGGIYCVKASLTSESDNSLTVKFNYGGEAGGIYLKDSSTLNSKYLISGNHATNGGGIMMASDTNSTPKLYQGTIENNIATNGGGIFYQKGTIESSSSTTYNQSNGTISNAIIIKDNQASTKGGGIWFAAEGSLADCNISGNISPSGAGIYAENNLTVEDSVISTNKKDTTHEGQAIYASANLTLKYGLNINSNNELYFTGANSLIFSNSSFYLNNNQKIPLNASSLSDGFILSTTSTIGYGKYFKSANSSYTFQGTGSNYCFYLNSKHVVSRDSSKGKSFQDIIDGFTTTSSDNPGIIIFSEDYQENSNNHSKTITGTTYYSPAFFNHVSPESPSFYIIYGNGHTYDANRASSRIGSALYVGSNVNLEIRDLTITGGYAKTSSCTTWECGGGIFCKGKVTIKGNSSIGLPAPETPEKNSYTPSSAQKNIARKGAGIFVADSGVLIIYPMNSDCVSICGNYVSDASSSAPSGFVNGGGGIYVAEGGEALLQTTSTAAHIKIGYNYCNTGNGSAVYCEKSGIFRTYINSGSHNNGTEIFYNENADSNGGAPGIYLANEAIFDGEGLKIFDNYFSNSANNSKKIGIAIHCENKVIAYSSTAFKYMILSNTDNLVDLFLPAVFTYNSTNYNVITQSDSTITLKGGLINDSSSPYKCLSTLTLGFKVSDSVYKKASFEKDSSLSSGNIDITSRCSSW